MYKLYPNLDASATPLDASCRAAFPSIAKLPLLFFLFFFLVEIVFFLFVVFFLDFFVVFFLFFVVKVIGNGIQMDGVRLRHFQFGFTLRAAQDFSLFYFVLIHVNFGATIGTANHGTILRNDFCSRSAGTDLKP